MRKFITVTALILMVITSLFTGYAQSIDVVVNGQSIDMPVKPIIINGTTMVPVREIFEAVGATVMWDGATKTVTGIKGGTIVKLALKSKSASVNGVPLNLRVAPLIRNNKTLVPARFVAESLEAVVAWDNSTKTVIITTSEGREEMRGLWVASVINLDYPKDPSTDPEILKNEALAVLSKAAEVGLNTVFLQVRPTSDALYKSEYYPWSKYLTGTQGTAPDNGFDPLEFWITEAHKRDIELHAWINPYRITKKKAGENAHDYASLDPSNPAIVNPDWVVEYHDGNLYYNPGLPEVRQFLVESTLELVNNYDIDGIHMDDYFYPGKDFNDSESFAQYGQAFSSIHDWRRENVNILVRDLGKAINEASDTVQFGISPFGIWCNLSSTKLGSDTRGMQSYVDQYADSRKWVKEGYLDYIIPQLYWHIGFEIADYSKLVAWWSDVARDTGVDLYIGQAAYRAGSTNPESAWYGVSEMKKQLDLNAEYPEVKGSVFFNYTAIATKPDLAELLQQRYLE